MSSPPVSVQTADSPESTQQPPSDTTPPNTDSHEQQPQKPLTSPRPMRKYTRQQLVSLSNSPLVKPPPNMPDLKVWFGSENENLAKKDEPTTPNTARDRRFRRDAEDGEPPARPTFRTALTQPSQMGNFKHQSLRASDRDRERDRERDGEKEREREIREKEGHERLRHLSDKFDRDRLALPLSGTRKERDAAPHLNTSNSRASQTLSSNAASRRAETREATKKKVGEASEDWRRGAEPPRSTRDERSENGKREDRDRARSRARDSSRPKRETSISQRDRDDPREKPPRGDRERDEHRRDKDEARRDRENDAEDDPRRWRDDGKRDERMAARRERERGRDKDNNWEGGADKRWGAGDDREGRYKRTGRERRTGNAADEVKEKEDRREKEREKEKEPAWMDTYVPNENMSGILGGQGPNGELDGIQAWKKGMKEKESKEKDTTISTLSKESELEKPALPALPENVDEIQLFKFLMKQEEEKKRTEAAADSGEHISLAAGKSEDLTNSTQLCPPDTDNAQPVQFPFRNMLPTPVENPSSQDSPSVFPFTMKDLDKALPTAEPSAEQATLPTKLATAGGALDSYQRVAIKQSGDFDASFQPPPGSRLLAFARPLVKNGSSGNALNSLQVQNGGLPSIGSEPSQGFAKSEPPRPQSGFSPFEDQRQLYGFDESRNSNLPHNMHSRAPIDQTFSANITAQVETNYNNGAAVSKGGSRFAKFFDGKSRDGLPPAGKLPMGGGFTSPSPNQLQRQEQVSLVTGTSNDQRAMEELFAMLNNSSQRGNLGHVPQSNPNSLLNNNQPFGTPGPSLHALQHQHLLQQPQHHNSRLEPLYDSRAEDRNFVPDGMVPGLRPIPPPPARGRDGPFIDQLEESLPYNFQRIPHQQPQQHIRNVDPLYPQTGPAPLFAQQTGRSTGGLNMQSLQQPHIRGGPSPNINQGSPVSNGQQQQRLPPGLANLGGRPPHEPSQFLGLPGLPSNVPHNTLHANGPLAPQQLPFNNFNGANNMSFNNTQIRGPMPIPNLHHTNPQQHPLGSLGPNIDPRLPNPHPLMGLGGSGGNGSRTTGGFPQQGPSTPSHIGMRPQQQQQQQQQAHLLPHMLPHLIPPHLQQQGHPGSNNPPAHDLMALLMGGPHRE